MRQRSTVKWRCWHFLGLFSWHESTLRETELVSVCKISKEKRLFLPKCYYELDDSIIWILRAITRLYPRKHTTAVQRYRYSCTAVHHTQLSAKFKFQLWYWESHFRTHFTTYLPTANDLLQHFRRTINSIIKKSKSWLGCAAQCSKCARANVDRRAVS